MKVFDLRKHEYTQKQKELDNIIVDISIGRYCDYYDGTIIAALRDDECDELIKKYNEFFNALKCAHNKSIERTEWKDDYILLIDV